MSFYVNWVAIRVTSQLSLTYKKQNLKKFTLKLSHLYSDHRKTNCSKTKICHKKVFNLNISNMIQCLIYCRIISVLQFNY